MTLAEINRRIQRTEPNVELVRAEGYHYYAFSSETPNVFETESVMTPYTNRRAAGQWVADGIAFGARMRREHGA